MGWCNYDVVLPDFVGDEDPVGLTSRVLSAYHNYFAVSPHSMQSWNDPDQHKGTNKPCVLTYLRVSLCPDR